MSWSPVKQEALQAIAPEGHELADFVELMRVVPDQDVPLIVARIQTDRAKPDNDP